MSWRHAAPRWLVRCVLFAIRRAQLSWQMLRYRLLPLTTVPLGYLRSHRQCVAIWPDGQVTLNRSVALYSHFDRDGAVRPDVMRCLVALQAPGLSVVLVSNSGVLQADAMTRLQQVCAAVLIRRNIGYDFCAWRDALEQLGLPRADTELLLIANDSVYGPLRPLAPLLARIATGDADIWGLTDSHQIRFHLQSYFLGFRAPALRSDAWRRFWSRVRPLPSKHAVILRYELGLTKVFMRDGLRCQALWPAAGFPLPAHLKSPSLLRLNPTHDLWRQLLDAGFPFIKRELLHDNPARVPDVSEWRRIVHASDGAVLTEIEQDLPRAAA